MLEGRSALDASPISGESVPLEATPGASVFGGSVNLDGKLLIRISKIGAEMALGRIVALMQTAERAKPPVTRLLERYAGRYMALVLLIAAASWFATGSVAGLLAVLVAACPCALVLAAPATSIAAIAVAARHGILVKGAGFLENLATADAVVFDKTGTLTIGELRVCDVRPEPGIDSADLVQMAATLAAASNHPVSRALAALTPRENFLPITGLRELPGLGVGVAMGATGSDLALASADVVLLSNNLRRLATSIRLSRRCRRTIHGNVALGLGWTAVLIGFASTGLLGVSGALLAAILHNLGTLAVMANAGRLLRFQEEAQPANAQSCGGKRQ